MRLVHLSDLHLGFRQFARVTPLGVNQREADVEQTFHVAIDKIIALAPELIVIGGDVFHVVRPSNHAVVMAFQEFQRLTLALPSTRIVLVAGNHDTPRSTETGGILALLRSLGIQVVDQGAARITYEDVGLSVLAVPDVPGLVRPAFTPDPASRFNVLIMHGEVQGMLTGAAAADRAAMEIPTDELNAPAWDYIGLGHWHVYRPLAPNMAYSGSIDYTSSNPWGEMVEERARGLAGKGFVERDLVTGVQTFHPLPVSRPYVELPTFSAAGMTSEEIDAALRAAVDACEGGIDDKVVRIVVTDVPRDLGRAVDQKAWREYKQRALNFALDMRRPDVERTVVMGRQVAKRGTFEETINAFLASHAWAADVNPIDAIAGAQAYLEMAKDPGESDTALAELLEATLAGTNPVSTVPEEVAA